SRRETSFLGKVGGPRRASRERGRRRAEPAAAARARSFGGTLLIRVVRAARTARRAGVPAPANRRPEPALLGAPTKERRRFELVPLVTRRRRGARAVR